MFRGAGRRLAAWPWGRIIAGEVAVVCGLGLLSVLDGMALVRAEAGEGGGLIGWAVATLLGDWLGGVFRVALLAVAGAGATAYFVVGVLPRPRIPTTAVPPEAPSRSTAARAAPQAALGTEGLRAADAAMGPARESRRAIRAAEAGQSRRRPGPRPQDLPPLDILEVGEEARITAKDINRTAGQIETTLADFGLPARVVSYRVGPAVTQFAVEPGFVEAEGAEGTRKRQKVRVSQISALASDLALALSAPSLRIEAPVPGQAYVGIEVPNPQPALVRLRPILESDAFRGIRSPLAIPLGRDVSGHPVAADLASMPHLLIAGTTGSGKSVCMAAIAMGLILGNAPEDLRLVMIDPKMVELVRFNGLPHLFARVETDLQRIVGVLRWCTMEMDRRYRLLEQASARDLEAYNARTAKRNPAARLPRVVVMIDELADLMMMAPDQTERTLVRLAQMARAVGLHLVVATQRPSTDILTGLIKANFPARISFAVASMVDSRVILDTTGAETLLGRGDMLFLSPEAGSPVRLQGAYVSDREIEQAVAFWREEREPKAEVEKPAAPWEEVLSRQPQEDGKDEILERAIAIVRATGQASASMLQRRLRIGYPRAARLMDELEELGLVGRVQSGGKTREILVEDREDAEEEEAEGGRDDEEDHEGD
jgi:S-DNA-T family DNA segregation ATPase FtsK/SpoIIIE